MRRCAAIISVTYLLHEKLIVKRQRVLRIARFILTKYASISVKTTRDSLSLFLSLYFVTPRIIMIIALFSERDAAENAFSGRSTGARQGGRGRRGTEKSHRNLRVGRVVIFRSATCLAPFTRERQLH